MTRLEPCPSCRRHVLVVEPACPFCGVSLASAFAALAERPMPTQRLGRAALFAFGMGALASGAACIEAPDDGDDDAAPGAHKDAGNHDGGAAADSGVARDSGTSADSGAVLDSGGIVPLYGLSFDAGGGAVLPDAGKPLDAGRDAGHDAGGVIALYGAPAFPGGGKPNTGADAGGAPGGDLGGAIPIYGLPTIDIDLDGLTSIDGDQGEHGKA